MTKRTLQEIISFLRSKKIFGTDFTHTYQYLLNSVEFSPDHNTQLKKVEAVAGDFSLFVCANGVASIVPVYENGKIKISWLDGVIKSLDLPWRIHSDHVPLGLLATGLHRNISLPHSPHIVVAGASGSGKSYWMHNAIQTSIKNGHHVFGLDPKWSEFARYTKFDNFMHIKDSKQVIGILDYIIDVMDKRYAEQYKLSVGDVEKNDAPSIPKQLIFIDELNDLLIGLGDDFLLRLLRIAQKGRAAGIHIICATQAPTAKLLSGELKANFPVKIAFKTASAVASRVVLGVSGAETLRGAGDGLCISENGELVRFRGYLVKDQAWIDEQEFLRSSFLERVRSRLKAVM